MNGTSLKIAGLCGSLRKDSYNKKLLLVAQKLLEADGSTVEFLPSELPSYNSDRDLPSAQSRPESVELFRQQLHNADGILIVSPEYNYSLPGHLKNALDWASRGSDSPLRKKPVSSSRSKHIHYGNSPYAGGIVVVLFIYGYETGVSTRSVDC